MRLSVEQVFGCQLAHFKEFDHVLIAEFLQVTSSKPRISHVLKNTLKAVDICSFNDVVQVSSGDGIPIKCLCFFFKSKRHLKFN